MYIYHKKNERAMKVLYAETQANQMEGSTSDDFQWSYRSTII